MKSNFIIALVSLFLFTGCAAHFGTLKSDVSLNQANFKVVTTASGTSQTKLVMGFGGLKKEALIAEARKDLVTKANLTPSQVLANISLDVKTSIFPGFLPFVVIQKVTVTADVIEFVK
jgi:hypothetical protein